MAVRDILDKSKMLAYKIEKSNKPSLSQINNALITSKGPYPQPMLIDQLNYLRSMIDRADQRPGKDAYIRYEELKNQLKELQESYETLEDE